MDLLFSFLDTRQTEDMDISPEVTPPVVNSHQGGGHHNSIPTTSTSSTHHSYTNSQQSSNKHVSGKCNANKCAIQTTCMSLSLENVQA